MNAKYVLVLAAAIVAVGIAAQSASATAIHDAVMARSPVGYWEFQNNLNDSSGNGNTLTAFGSTGFTAGAPGGPLYLGDAANLDFTPAAGAGNGFYVNTPSGNALNIAGTAWSINLWYNSAVAVAGTMIPVHQRTSATWGAGGDAYSLWLDGYTSNPSYGAV